MAAAAGHSPVDVVQGINRDLLRVHPVLRFALASLHAYSIVSELTVYTIPRRRRFDDGS
jgi:hypothetical protein